MEVNGRWKGKMEGKRWRSNVGGQGRVLCFNPEWKQQHHVGKNKAAGAESNTNGWLKSKQIGNSRASSTRDQMISLKCRMVTAVILGIPFRLAGQVARRIAIVKGAIRGQWCER